MVINPTVENLSDTVHTNGNNFLYSKIAWTTLVATHKIHQKGTLKTILSLKVPSCDSCGSQESIWKFEGIQNSRKKKKQNRRNYRPILLIRDWDISIYHKIHLFKVVFSMFKSCATITIITCLTVFLTPKKKLIPISSYSSFLSSSSP